jgi:hypothetical protein
MIRKLKSGSYRLYSRKKNPKTGKRRNLGTFKSRSAAEKHERAVQYFKHGQSADLPGPRSAADHIDPHG